MSADTPTPERVSAPVISYPDQCCPGYCVEALELHNVSAHTAERATEEVAAREQALREEIAGEIETARDDMCRVTRTDPRHTIARVYDEAARIARGAR